MKVAIEGLCVGRVGYAMGEGEIRNGGRQEIRSGFVQDTTACDMACKVKSGAAQMPVV